MELEVHLSLLVLQPFLLTPQPSQLHGFYYIHHPDLSLSFSSLCVVSLCKLTEQGGGGMESREIKQKSKKMGFCKYDPLLNNVED
jgi:hypothetical protein